jgi:hypothetical protein
MLHNKIQFGHRKNNTAIKDLLLLASYEYKADSTERIPLIVRNKATIDNLINYQLLVDVGAKSLRDQFVSLTSDVYMVFMLYCFRSPAWFLCYIVSEVQHGCYVVLFHMMLLVANLLLVYSIFT